MKKIYTILVALFAMIQFSYAQWISVPPVIYTTTDKVGIGTSTPSSLLTIGSSTMRGTLNVIGSTATSEVPAISISDSRTNGHAYTLYSGLSAPGDFNIYDQNAGVHRFLINSLGNVGIGSTAPIFKFQVESTIPGVAKFGTSSTGTTSNIAFLNGSNYGYGIVGIVRGTGGLGGDVYGLGYNPNPNTSFTSVLNWTSTNLVGIGTTYPNAKLDVNGAVVVPGSSSNIMSRPIVGATRIVGEIAGYSESGYTLADGFLRLSAGGGNDPISKSFIDLSGFSTIPDMKQNITLGTSGAERIRITQNGYIGIGTKTPDDLLTVNGTIHSREVKVNLSIAGPDYVFEPDYQLPELSEIKAYVDKNHHLPEIPSAATMAKDGITLGEMNIKLLKKVEELTLYLIEQQKINQSLQDQINKLSKQLAK
jgi:hypothetical protein